MFGIGYLKEVRKLHINYYEPVHMSMYIIECLAVSSLSWYCNEDYMFIRCL